ncbi:hypothetical protein [Halosimplex halophilum]|uniref:hypothetical protein n=1 Tax=Halosimplex halophilum TaxID=2559572 RepID=UPI00107F6984|nr:hypothetical protein [Halosimplex halophilum]
MGRRDIEPFSESATYRVARTLRRWAEGSVLLSRLDGERALSAALAAVVLVSVASVFRSNLGAGVKFLSFALVFVSVAALTERFLYPEAE